MVKDYDGKISIIEIYNMVKGFKPKLIQTIVEYEKITGITWTTQGCLLTTSLEQKINIYDPKTGKKELQVITDYGPITCMKFEPEYDLLLTGTIYGYVVAYSIAYDSETREITPINKMVKISGQIRSVDCTMKQKEVDKENNRNLLKSAKRKRTTSDSSSSSSDEKGTDEVAPLDKLEITIFGAHQREVVVWDYHKKTIFETIKVGDSESCIVNTLLTKRNGDLFVGDSTGTISLYDGVSLTCKHSLNVSLTDIMCMAKNSVEDTLLVSGKDPSLIIVRLADDSMKLFEKIEQHIQEVRSIIFVGKKNFFSGSMDGMLIKYHLKGRHKKLKLHKETIIHNYTNHINFFNERMMIQLDKSLVIWKLPKIPIGSLDKTSQEELRQAQAIKSLLIKTRCFIQASAFTNEYVAYATKKGLCIYNKAHNKTLCNKNILNCNHLEFCGDKFLIAAQYDRIELIDLNSLDYDIIAEKQLDSTIKQLLFINSYNMLVVACNAQENCVYFFDCAVDDPSKLFDDMEAISLDYNEIMCITHNSATERDKNLYVYTNQDKLIKIDLNKKAIDKSKLDSIEPIKGLPEDANILGMFVLTSDYCVIYDNKYVLKIDLKSNEVISQMADYKFIIKMSNRVFDNPSEIALVELTPEDYEDTLPPVEQRTARKFGT